VNAQSLDALVQTIADRLLARGERLATAESCTGGLIAKLLTDLAGSSAWFERGLVTYSNEAKAELLGVTPPTLTTHGAVSGPAVLEMANGLLQRAPVQWTLAVSGIAGPGGGTADKPVGSVWIAWAGRGVSPSASRFRFDGDREQVRYRTALAALDGLAQLLVPPVG
jgi:nicotinamide-nucleotide amidase